MAIPISTGIADGVSKSLAEFVACRRQTFLDSLMAIPGFPGIAKCVGTKTYLMMLIVTCSVLAGSGTSALSMETLPAAMSDSMAL